VEGPIRIRELGDIAPEIPAAQTVRNPNRLSSKAVFGDVIFVFKERNEYQS
jgi:hypothetical protein